MEKLHNMQEQMGIISREMKTLKKIKEMLYIKHLATKIKNLMGSSTD